MPDICVAEMTCDLYARAQEFGTGLREWIEEVAMDKYNIDRRGENYKSMMQYVDILLDNSFVPGVRGSE